MGEATLGDEERGLARSSWLTQSCPATGHALQGKNTPHTWYGGDAPAAVFCAAVSPVRCATEVDGSGM